MAVRYAVPRSTTVSIDSNSRHISTNNMAVSTLSCLITSTSFRAIIPLWHAKENKMDHFQAEGMIVGWDLFLNSGQKGQSVLSNTCSQSSEIDFLDYSLSDRITTSARKIDQWRDIALLLTPSL